MTPFEAGQWLAMKGRGLHRLAPRGRTLEGAFRPS